jgi:polyhydroxybutyrate depolymerase
MSRLLLSLSALVLLGCGSDALAPGDATSTSPAATTPPGPPPPTPPSSSSEPPAPPPADGGSDAQSKPACPATANAKPGETTETITVGGVSRTFIVHVPPGYTGASPVPLVLDFHPMGVSAGLWKLATGWAGIADSKNFVVVWPQGIDDKWNVGRCCNTQDDVAFVRAMVAKVEAEACIDPKRVYSTGCSNGGGMTYRLACDAADIIAAGAPVDFDCITGPTNSPSCGNCAPTRPMSITQFRGTKDGSVPYDGGPTSVVAGLEFPGAKANFADWAARNACTGTSHPDPAHPTCDTYSTCGGGTSTTLCTVPLGMHCTSYLTFGIADIAWAALSKSTMP